MQESYKNSASEGESHATISSHEIERKSDDLTNKDPIDSDIDTTVALHQIPLTNNVTDKNELQDEQKVVPSEFEENNKTDSSTETNEHVECEESLADSYDINDVKFSAVIDESKCASKDDTSEEKDIQKIKSEEKNYISSDESICQKKPEAEEIQNMSTVEKEGNEFRNESSMTGIVENINVSLNLKNDLIEEQIANFPQNPVSLNLKNDLAEEQIANFPQSSADRNLTPTEIIFDIESTIKKKDKLNELHKVEQELLMKHEELTREIQQQQLLAQNLAVENKLQEQRLKELQMQESQQLHQSAAHRPSQIKTERIYKNPITSLNNCGQTDSVQTHEVEEANTSEKINLKKVLMPATDFKGIGPKCRKLYASSAFYSPSFHPTVEDQIKLARGISHSLSDISNKTSRGQRMYINRKKRSVKWVHEGFGQGSTQEKSVTENTDPGENLYENNAHNNESNSPFDMISLKLVMNPRGQVRDFDSWKESMNFETGQYSPEKCADLVSALQTQKSRGAELFAKRRKKSVNWIIDESNAGCQNPSDLADYKPCPPNQVNILPAYSDAGRHLAQLNVHQNEVMEKYLKLNLKEEQVPLEKEQNAASKIALNTKDYILKDAENLIYNNFPSTSKSFKCYTDNADDTIKNREARVQYKTPNFGTRNCYRDLAYRPSIPQGWQAPSYSIPKELYLPKEIPLESYAPPPVNPQSLKLTRQTEPTSSLPSVGASHLMYNPSPIVSKNWIKFQDEPNRTENLSPMSYITKQKKSIWSGDVDSTQNIRAYPLNSNFQCFQKPNFNTVARGWNGKKDVKTSEKNWSRKNIISDKRAFVCLPYTDF